MISNETEYRDAVERWKGEEERLHAQRALLKAKGLKREEIDRVSAPVQSFHDQLREEIESYERLRRGDFDEVLNFQGVGRLLIALRISQGLSQRELADRLGVHESQVSRDERNEYHGVTLERAARVLEALGLELRTTVAARVPSRKSARKAVSA